MLAAELLHYQTRDVKVESPPPIMVGAAAADPVVGDVWVDAAVDEGGGSSSLEQEINDEFEERSASPLSNGNELDNEFDQILEEEMAFSGPGGEGVEEELSRSSRPRRVDVFHHHLHRHRVSPAPAKKRMAVSSVPARGEAKDRSLVDEESIISQGIWASVFRSRFAEGRRDGKHCAVLKFLGRVRVNMCQGGGTCWVDACAQFHFHIWLRSWRGFETWRFFGFVSWVCGAKQ